MNKFKLTLLASLMCVIHSANAEVFQYTSSTDVSDSIMAEEKFPGGVYLNGIRAYGMSPTDVPVVTLNSPAVKVNMDFDFTGISSAYAVTGVNASGFYKNGDSVVRWQGANLNLGGEITKNIDISVNVSGELPNDLYGHGAIGIWAYNQSGNKEQTGGQITVTAENLKINVHSEDGYSYGVLAQNCTTDQTDEEKIATVIINANNTVVNATSGRGSGNGLVAMSQGILKVTGNLEVNADNAITARGDAIVRVNESGNDTVKLNGNINFDFDKGTSGTKVDADVLVKLSGKDSVWNGSPVVSWASGKPEDLTKLEVNSLNLTLNKEAVWNPTIINEKLDDDEGHFGLALNKLDFNDGIINIKEGADQVVQVENLSGTGGTINTVATTDGTTVSAGQLQAASVEGTPHFTVNALGINSDDITNQQKALESLYASALNLGDNSEATATLNIAEGNVAGALTAETSADGVSVQEAQNTVNASLIDIASSNYLFFRSQINDVSARMGDLRSMPKTAGAWVRYYGGQNKYSDRGQKEKYNTIQIGGDAFINDNFYLGGTFSYTDGDGTLKNGSTDDKNYNFGIYGGWIGEKGQFVDVIIKRHRVETDFDLYNANGLSSGSYHNWGTTASVEAGWRLQCPTTGFYAEPQVELQFGRLDSVNYRTGKGVKVEQDGIDSIIGRAGVAVGYTFPENKGTAYAKASVLHDWKGEVKSTFSANGVERTYKDDLGGTWGEFAVGATYNPTKNVSAYTQVKTSTGSPVRNPWQVSVGLRYNF